MFGCPIFFGGACYTVTVHVTTQCAGPTGCNEATATTASKKTNVHQLGICIINFALFHNSHCINVVPFSSKHTTALRAPLRLLQLCEPLCPYATKPLHRLLDEPLCRWPACINDPRTVVTSLNREATSLTLHLSERDNTHRAPVCLCTRHAAQTAPWPYPGACR